MHASIAGTGLRVAAALGFLLTTAAGAQAPAVVTGVIAEAGSGVPIDRARITGVRQRLSGRTDREGRYRLTRVSAGDLILRIEAPGFITATEQIAVAGGDSTVANFQLIRTDQVLSAVMAGRVTDPDTGASADPAVPRRSGTEVLGSVPGVEVRKGGGGQVGTGTSVQIRGLKSFVQSHDPLIFVDGILVAGGGSSQVHTRVHGLTFLDLLDPASIDRIEVLRGPAAAVEYGEGALNGVVLIHTRTGGNR